MLLIRKRKINKEKSQLIIGSFIIIIGILMISFKYFILVINEIEKKEKNDIFYLQQDIEIKNHIDNNIENKIINNEKEVKKNNIKNENIKCDIDYIAMLNIDKINLRQGLVSKENKNNIISKNIKILDESDLPDQDKGNVILAAHSGNSSISFFKNIDKLKKGDIINIFYNKKNYEYSVVNFYFVEKTGKVNIIRNINKSTLTLITCKDDNSNKQIVIISEQL